MKKVIFSLTSIILLASCRKESTPSVGHPPSLNLLSQSINGVSDANLVYYNVSNSPAIRVSFSGGAIDKSSVATAVLLKDANGNDLLLSISEPNDSTLSIQPTKALSPISSYTLELDTTLRSVTKGTLYNIVNISIVTAIDSADKFPRIPDSALLTLVQQQTFAYFWDFGHPVSGMARERNSSGDVVTTGGSGFGIMSILVGVQRRLITRAQGLSRINQIVLFLTNNAKRYHGAFPHWMDGATGATVPFSSQDDGADLVETAYMMQGLLCARQYFNSAADSGEINLRIGINNLWNGVDWNWFRQNGQNTLYWHWSPDFAWESNQQINGWDEAMITYVLAASANSDSIPKIVYDNGWALNGSIRNGKNFYGITLPLGPDYGGPLFFAHYSFLGLNPVGLSDAYAEYWIQDTAQSRINYDYCVANPGRFNGYSSLCWGLTASDEQHGYLAHSPSTDDGVISPTAAISSLPYTPTESMNALRFFYYTLGDKLWGPYGFYDAFNLTNVWFANSSLAIDQGPQIIMIENYRTGLLWTLFMSCPEVQRGLTQLGFTSPNI